MPILTEREGIAWSAMANRSHGESRRSKRFALSIPILVNWQEPNGQKVQDEAATAVEVSSHGAVIEIRTVPPPGTELTLIDPSSNRSAKARALRVRRQISRVHQLLVIEMLSGNESLWGLNFQLKKSTADLIELERALVSGNTDPRILRDFRDAVDYVRKAAWVVQEWQERQSKSHDISTVLPLLKLERMRRATQLCKTIASDIDEMDVAESAAITDLSDAIEKLRARLTVPQKT